VLPEVLAKAADVNKDVEPGIVQAIGAIPGAYLNYVFHPDRMLAKKMGERARAEELLELQDDVLADFERSLAAGQKPTLLIQRKAGWYRDIIAPVLLALLEGTHVGTLGRALRFILNVVNGTKIPWLPSEAVVELPTLVENGQVRPLATGPVPVDVRALVQANCTYEMLAVQAIVEQDREKALRALLINPIVHTYDQAVGVLNRVWGQT
jgi:6-phospho-beta-glucosidase